MAYIFHLFVLKEPKSLSHKCLGLHSNNEQQFRETSVQLKLNLETQHESTLKNSDQAAFQGWAQQFQGPWLSASFEE